MRIVQGDPVEIFADEGMTLTNGETYSDYVCLGNLDSPDNWREVPETDESDDEEM